MTLVKLLNIHNKMNDISIENYTSYYSWNTKFNYVKTHPGFVNKRSILGDKADFT